MSRHSRAEGGKYRLCTLHSPVAAGAVSPSIVPFGGAFGPVVHGAGPYRRDGEWGGNIGRGFSLLLSSLLLGLCLYSTCSFIRHLSELCLMNNAHIAFPCSSK
jgi:hypothetical protein